LDSPAYVAEAAVGSVVEEASSSSGSSDVPSLSEGSVLGIQSVVLVVPVVAAVVEP